MVGRKPKNENLAPRAIGVMEVATSDLHANPHNPRRLFDELPLRELRDSIEKVGILVPLTVYREKARDRLIILDGQRRWMVAKALGLEQVPVNEVAEPNLVQNIVTMFQIHQLREDWQLMPTALKVEVLMDEMKERNEAKLASLTGLDKAVVSRCKKLLNYPKQFQDLMLDPDPEKRVRADFFIELYAVRNDRFVNSLTWYDRTNFTELMLERYRLKQGIKAVTDFRLMKQHINNARRAGEEREVARRLREFVESSELDIDHLVVKTAGLAVEATRLEEEIRKLIRSLRSMEPADFYGEERLWKQLEVLLGVVRRALRDADRRVLE